MQYEVKLFRFFKINFNVCNFAQHLPFSTRIGFCELVLPSFLGDGRETKSETKFN